MKNKNLTESFKNAAFGIIYAIRHERNMKIHLTASVVVLLLCLVYRPSRIEILVLCFTVALVLVCELLNTAIEALVDLMSESYHPKAKVAKDTAAGAALVSAVFSLAAAYFIFFHRVAADAGSFFRWLTG